MGTFRQIFQNISYLRVFRYGYHFHGMGMSTKQAATSHINSTHCMPSSTSASTLFPPIINDKSCTGLRKYSSNGSNIEKAAYNLLYIQIESQQDRNNLAALFLQATEGPNNTPEPVSGSQADIVIWKAWKQLGQMPKTDAEKKYISEASRLLKEKGINIDK